MSERHLDGSAGDANYGKIGEQYSHYRRADPRIAACIHRLLGNATTVVNVGAGAGSYEPIDRQVTAIEPSASMRSQRTPHLPPAIDAVAQRLPFPDLSFDAAMATFTVHQWPDLEAGLREMRRVTRGPVIVMTGDPTELDRFWLNDYAPEVIAIEARRYPSMDSIKEALGGKVAIEAVPIPLDCSDGFNEAYYGRPERLLEEGARLSCSAWSFVAPAAVARFVSHLRRDLDAGTWDTKYGHLRRQAEFDGSLKLVISTRVGQ